MNSFQSTILLFQFLRGATEKYNLEKKLSIIGIVLSQSFIDWKDCWSFVKTDSALWLFLCFQKRCRLAFLLLLRVSVYGIQKCIFYMLLWDMYSILPKLRNIITTNKLFSSFLANLTCLIEHNNYIALWFLFSWRNFTYNRS